MKQVLNVFQTVRPRGADLPAPAPAPRPKKAGRALTVRPGVQRVLDRSGKLSVPLAPRMGSLVVEGRKASEAARDRRAALVRGGL